MSPHAYTQHRNSTSWVDSPGSVLDNRATSTRSGLVNATSPDGANLGYSGGPGSRQSATSVFSQIFFPSKAKDSSSPMKFRLSKPSASSSKGANVPTRLQNVSSTLYDDPAFSPDPHTHPHFVTNRDSIWTPPTEGHPRLKGDRRLHTLLVDSDDASVFAPPQPPNTPMIPEDVYSHSGPSTSESISGSLTSPALSTPPTSAPSSTNSHMQGQRSASSVQPSNTPAQGKKKRLLPFFGRKAAPPVETNIPVADHPAEHRDSPPSYDVSTSLRPSRARLESAPELHRPNDRPTLAPRADTAPAPAVVNRQAERRRLRIQELDRIDELDETNPLGLSMHHGGPYEAIRKLARSTAHPFAATATDGGIQSQRNDAMRRSEKDRSHHPPHRRGQPSDATLVTRPPIGMSLNLTPGQVLPHDFQPWYPPQFQPREPVYSPIPPPPGHRTDFQEDFSRVHMYDNTLTTNPQHHYPQQEPVIPSNFSEQSSQMQSQRLNQQRLSRHQSMPADNSHAYSGIDVAQPHYLKRDRRSAPAVQSQTVNGLLGDVHSPHSNWHPSGASVFEDHAQHDNKSPQSQAQRPWGYPPGLSAPTYEHEHLQIAGSEGAAMLQSHHSNHGHSSNMSHTHRQHEFLTQVNHGSHQVNIPHSTHEHMPTAQYAPSHRPSHDGTSQATHQPSQDPANLPEDLIIQRNMHVSHQATSQMNHRPHDPPHDSQSQSRRPERERDAHSMQYSVATGSSSSTHTGVKPHQPRFHPKRLVMPAPLQPTHLNTPANLVFPQPHSQHQVHFEPQSQYHDPSPPTLLPPVLGSSHLLVQGAPMPEGRKLRKRPSVNGTIPIPKITPSPSASTVAFTADGGYVESPRPPPLSRSKSAKAPKNVLSKRRGDL